MARKGARYWETMLDVWLSLGPDRSFGELARHQASAVYGLPPGSEEFEKKVQHLRVLCSRVASKNGWAEAAREYDDEVRSIRIKRMAAELASVDEQVFDAMQLSLELMGRRLTRKGGLVGEGFVRGPGDARTALELMHDIVGQPLSGNTPEVRPLVINISGVTDADEETKTEATGADEAEGEGEEGIDES